MNFILVERIDEALKSALLPCKMPTVNPDVETAGVGTPDVSDKKLPPQPEVRLH